MDQPEAVGAWRKSSRSISGECVEICAWRKTSYSISNGACAEVGSTPSGVGVRDTTDRDGAVLVFPARAWEQFIARTRYRC